MSVFEISGSVAHNSPERETPCPIKLTKFSALEPLAPRESIGYVAMGSIAWHLICS